MNDIFIACVALGLSLRNVQLGVLRTRPIEKYWYKNSITVTEAYPPNIVTEELKAGISESTLLFNSAEGRTISSPMKE